jgi:hypothetical protein
MSLARGGTKSKRDPKDKAIVTIDKQCKTFILMPMSEQIVLRARRIPSKFIRVAGHFRLSNK